MASYRSEQDLVALLRSQIGENGTQKDWAAKAGVSAVYVSDFLQGKRNAGPAILRALGFDPKPYYRRVES